MGCREFSISIRIAAGYGKTIGITCGSNSFIAIGLQQTLARGKLFARGSIPTPFFGIEKWTADSPWREKRPKTRVSMLLRCSF
jgi:hypothetical protein